MPLGYHLDCRSTGKWVKDGVCSACGQRVVLRRPETKDAVPSAPKFAEEARPSGFRDLAACGETQQVR